MQTESFLSQRYADLISLLVLWHRLDSLAVVAGYPSESPSCAGYKTSRQYDSDNGSFESEARSDEAHAVGRLVMLMDDPFRTALCLLARNRATGVTVWRSPRLPADQDECREVLAEALSMLSERA